MPEMTLEGAVVAARCKSASNACAAAAAVEASGAAASAGGRPAVPGPEAKNAWMSAKLPRSDMMLDGAVVAARDRFASNALAESGTAELCGTAVGARWLRSDMMLDGAVMSNKGMVKGGALAGA